MIWNMWRGIIYWCFVFVWKKKLIYKSKVIFRLKFVKKREWFVKFYFRFLEFYSNGKMCWLCLCISIDYKSIYKE